MTEGFKTCPFCDCEVKLKLSIYGIHGRPDYWSIIHPENDCILSGLESYSTDDKTALMEDWNTRKGVSE